MTRALGRAAFIGGMLFVTVGAACGGDDTTAASASTGLSCHAVLVTDITPGCAHGWTSCSDGQSHSVSCLDDTTAPYDCTCSVSQQPTGTFSTQDFCALVNGTDSAALLAAANAACGWDIHTN